MNRHQATCTRTDRDMYRICPSKLSRRELENLYFSLLENNVDLKKNLNMQQEKIKTLSVKVQRLSYPRNCNAAGKDCPGTAAIVNEQKDSIIQLKRANDRMAERIRVLNMKLCSVKQFAGKNKANNLNNVTLSSSNTKSNCSTSCTKLDKAGPSHAKTNSVGTQSDCFAEKYSNSSCDIKCKPTINELNVKINNLQEELQISRQRIEKLEALVIRLQGENQTVRGGRAVSELALQQQDAKLDEVKEKLRCAEAKVNDMNMELTLEKKKLAELETELKLAGNIRNMSSSTAKTIEEIKQINVGGEAIAPTDEAKLIMDELNVASDEVHRAQDKVKFIRGEVSNVERNDVNRVPDDVEYNWGDVMARTKINTETDDKIFARGEKDVAENEVNKVLENRKNLTTKEVNKITDDIELTRDEEKMARNEDIGAADDIQFVNGEQINETRICVNRVPDEVEYNWGDYMTGCQVDTEENEVNFARHEINRPLDDKSRVIGKEVDNLSCGDDIQFIWSEGINKTSNDTNRVPDDVNTDEDIKLTKKEINIAGNEVKRNPEEKEVTRDEVTMARNKVNKVPDDIGLTSNEKKLAINEVNKVPNDVEYSWGENVDVPKIEVKNEKDDVKSLRDEVKDDSGYREQQDLNKNIETEKDQQNIKLNQDLINKISELVSQLEMLKITAAGAYTVANKIVKEKPTESKQHGVKNKTPDAISSPANKQKLTQKSNDVKTKETNNTPSQAKKEMPMQFKSYEAKPKNSDRISLPINKKKPTQNEPYYVKPKKPEAISSPTSINKQTPIQQSYESKMKETDMMITSQTDKEKQNQYGTCGGTVEATDNISIRNDKPMKYDSNDVKTEVGDILIQKNKEKPTMHRSEEDDDIVTRMTKNLAEYESIEVPAKEADNILRRLSNANAPKYESYDFETKEFDDILTNNDTIECILEVNSTKERNNFKIQEPVSNNAVKGMSRDSEQKPINYPTTPVDEFDLSHEQSMFSEKLSRVSPIAQEAKSKMIPKSPRSDDDPRYQIPGPIPVDLNDQKREVSGVPYIRKSFDDTSEIDSYRKRPTKISYVEKSKQVGSISESPLKRIIDEKSAKSKNFHGESLRKKSLEEKSEKIRKTFCETSNRISFQNSSEDNITKPFRDLSARQSFDRTLMEISATDSRGRPGIKSKDPMSTRPSISLSDKIARISIDDNSQQTLPFDDTPRLSLSPKNAAIIKDYARDVELKSKKVRQRFSTPCATVMNPDSSRNLQTTESILKSKDAGTSPCIRESCVNDGPSTSFPLNMNDGGYAPPTVGGQENAGIVLATTTADRMRVVDEPFEICGASAMVCVCPPSETLGVSAFRTCEGNIRFRTTQPQDNIRHCACRAKALDHYDGEMGAGASSRRDSGTSMGKKAPGTSFSVAGKHSRATSPDNTDHEIPSITDWASEKGGQRSSKTWVDARARIDSLSEERGTTTDSDLPSDHYTTASEGEVRGGFSSLGERDPGQGSYQAPQRQSLNKNDSMESTLQTISEELARCRKLLSSQRNQEKDKSVEHELRASPAIRQLSATYTPVCVFTLHIGTLVLSDDTMLWSRDKNLVLTWKFFSQSAAMTRVQPGRVAIFDFVTEYDVIFNDDILNYMKNSDMPIVLCELGKEQEPYAKCSLPLQEALLHANRRADMSLALVPCQTNDTDSRQGFGEEVGVLDIWCSLRLERSLLPVIDRAMHKPSNNNPLWNPTVPRESRIIQQAAEDEPSRDSSASRQSRNFGLDRLSQHKRAPSMKAEVPRRSYCEYPTGESDDRNFYVPGQDIPCHASERYADETQENQQVCQQPRYNFHSFSSPAQKAQLDYGNSGRDVYDKWSSPDNQPSGIIINEVPANIRTDNDMRQALEQQVKQDNMTTWPKMEEYDVSLKHSSFGSVRSLAARHKLAKLKSPQKHQPDLIATDSFQDILNKDKQYIPDNMEGSDPNFAKSANAYKYVGVPGIYKLAEASRKSVKYSNAIERESLKPSPILPAQLTIDITILWLALNEECEAMANPNIKRLYVAYSFLGRKGAELETPFSLPKPKHYADKCYFNFKKSFNLHETDLSMLGHMATCRSGGERTTDPRDCIVFTLVSEPPEDPLGLSSCEDVGYAYLYLGDVLAYCGGSNGYTEVVGVRGVRGGVCGVLAVRVDNLAVLRLCLS